MQKNSLADVHGFPPFQLALVQNPKLPPVINENPPAMSSPTTSKILIDNLTAQDNPENTVILTSTCAGWYSFVYSGGKLYIQIYTQFQIAITALPILIVTKALVTLFITLLVNAIKIRRDTKGQNTLHD